MTFKPTDYLPYDFANRRHIGPSPAEMADMLDTIGVTSLDALIDTAVPEVIRLDRPLDLPPPASEHEALEELRSIVSKNPLTSRSSTQSNCQQRWRATDNA